MSHDRPVALADGNVIHRDPEILSGTPVFVGTRVPVRTLIEHLQGGYSIDGFLDQFPTVRRARVDRFLDQATDALLERVDLHF